jgi:hypothetical protein
MPSRLDLQSELEKILGSRNVYFQPPASVQMKYPAIVYSRKSIDVQHANDSAYLIHPGYEIILIDKNPDSVFIERILQFRYCSFDRHYEKDNLNHDVFTLYY